MSIEDDKYFNDYNVMFRSDGWKTLLNELEDNRLEICKIENTQTLEDLWYRKGQLDTIGYVQSLEAQMELINLQ